MYGTVELSDRQFTNHWNSKYLTAVCRNMFIQDDWTCEIYPIGYVECELSKEGYEALQSGMTKEEMFP